MSKFELTARCLDETRGEIALAGSLDAETFEELDRAFQDLFRQGRWRVQVLADRVKFVSSAGAGVFIGARAEAQQHGGLVVLVNPAPAVSEVFDLLGVLPMFPVAASREEALRLLAGGEEPPR